MYREKTLEKKIAEWSAGEYKGMPVQLWEYLGWTQEEYNHWVATGEQPENAKED